jgi:SAM-dependent methyltransferase
VDRSSRNRLNERHLALFPGETLFERIARAACRAGCLPRKELYEAWEVARRVHRRFRGARVVDLASGHGLLAQILLLLDRDVREAVAVDRRIPENAAVLAAELESEWPGLSGRMTFLQQDLEQVPLQRDDIVVSVHACGALTDLVLERAMAARCRVAVLPCCHDLRNSDAGGLQGWLDGGLSVDVTRAARLRAGGYQIYTQTIPADITPKNRLLLGEPNFADDNVTGQKEGVQHDITTL